jgi:NAD(P)H-dependent FMN reductase
MSEIARLRLAVIVSSTRNGRFGPTIADWFAGHARRREDLDVDLIDLAGTRLPETLPDEDDVLPPSVRELAPRLDAADAFAIVTPEYNRSFPAPLKTAIDWYTDEWRAKPVTVVSYGRASGGLHVTNQLRDVFAELHAITIPTTIAIANYWHEFDADGAWPKPSAACHTALQATLTELAWWAHALRDARAQSPYPG